MSADLPYRIVVLSSGEGTNLQKLIERHRDATNNIHIDAVFCDRVCRSLHRAESAGITAHHLAIESFADRAAYDAALADRIDKIQPRLIVLAGFMRVLGSEFVARFEGRMINIHPSLLPRYRGLDTHRRVLEAGDANHGATVHFVTEELDGGPSVLQYRIPVLKEDDEASLGARLQKGEHIILPRALEWFSDGRLGLEREMAMLDGAPLEAPIVVEDN